MDESFTPAELLTAEALADELINRANIGDNLLERLCSFCVTTRVWFSLHVSGPQNFNEMTRMGFNRTTLSRCLKKLTSAGIVDQTGSKYYAIMKPKNIVFYRKKTEHELYEILEKKYLKDNFKSIKPQHRFSNGRKIDYFCKDNMGTSVFIEVKNDIVYSKDFLQIVDYINCIIDDFYDGLDYRFIVICKGIDSNKTLKKLEEVGVEVVILDEITDNVTTV
jgi:DNA-binding transcriptional ArsR family regulator